MFYRKQNLSLVVYRKAQLGPLLFLLCFDPVAEVIENCKMRTTLSFFIPAKNIEIIQQTLANDFKRIADWMELNGLVTNMKKGKTESMIFGTNQKTKTKQTTNNSPFTTVITRSLILPPTSIWVCYWTNH